MRLEGRRSLRRWLLALPLAWLTATAWAADGLMAGELDAWLEATAAELGTTLSRHPRFRGETVRLVSVTAGATDGRSNQLAEAIERRLRQHLLAVEGVRLALDEPRRECQPPRQIGYLLRVEVGAAGGREGRVHVAVVDVAESVWVSGISHEWQGRLSSAQRAALSAPVTRGVPGSAGGPIPLQNAADVAQAIKHDLACTLPRNLSGALHVPTPTQPALARVGLALQSELMFEPLAAVTPDRDQARWLLSLEAGGGDADADVRELNLTLVDVEGGHRQRVASVFVSGALDDAPAQLTRPPIAESAVVTPPPAAEPAAPLPPPPWLSDLTMRPAAPEGICDDRRARINSCVEITFELLEPAYLFVVSTRDHRVVEAPCDRSPGRAEPGTRRFRVRVPPGRYAVESGRTGPDAGFYVIATRERRAARQLGRVLAGASDRCGATPAPAAGVWLDELARVMAGQDDRIAWRALHLAHDTGGIVSL